MDDYWRRRLQGIMERAEHARNNREMEEVLADPKANARTTLFTVDVRYRMFDGGRAKGGERLWFCYSTVKNAAGFFLTWRELEGDEETRRTHHQPHRMRKAAKRMCAIRADEARASQGLPLKYQHFYQEGSK